MAIEYIPYVPVTANGQAILNNFVRTKRYLSYRGNNEVYERIARGMPLYETKDIEIVGNKDSKNLMMRGECLTACAYLKKNNIKVDLVYIDPPFASGADYAKKVFIRRNPKVVNAIEKAEQELEDDELKSFEEKMYGDIWDKERYLNWMYENLCAIKSVMSDTASIYVHLDWHIGHYVKILMDEIFGEDNFRNEIIWSNLSVSGFKGQANKFIRGHDSIFVYQNGSAIFNKQFLMNLSENTIKRYNKIDEKGRRYKLYRENGIERRQYLDENKGIPISDSWIDIPSLQTANMTKEFANYATQKPEALLERIIKASSNEGMLVADFFGGSGVTAAVANRLVRNFIHVDVGINSIQTARDRLKAQDASFTIKEIMDGVSLYRNPQQTMDNLKKLIPGLVNEDALNEFWRGGVLQDPDLGPIPVYVPNLIDSSTKILDRYLMNRIIREAMPDLDDVYKKVIVYYIDIADRAQIEEFIKTDNMTGIDIELRDLKEVLQDAVSEDICEFSVADQDGKFIIDIKRYFSDRVFKKIAEYNNRFIDSTIKKESSKSKALISISQNGLECIEMISISYAEESAPWHSDYEIKIDNAGFLIINGQKTKNYWDGTVITDHKPAFIKIRNICGDEKVFKVES